MPGNKSEIIPIKGALSLVTTKNILTVSCERGDYQVYGYIERINST